MLILLEKEFLLSLFPRVCVDVRLFQNEDENEEIKRLILRE